jgi:hypothetical protein
VNTLRRVTIGVIATLLFIPMLPAKVAAVPGGGLPPILGDPFMRPILVKGTVLCTDCRLDEVRKARPDTQNLYELTHPQGSSVFQVRWVNDRHLWRTVAWPPQLIVRSSTAVFQQLTEETNIGKEVQLAGFLRSTRVFDIGQFERIDD